MEADSERRGGNRGCHIPPMRFCSYVRALETLKIRFFFTTLLEHEKALVELRSKIRDHEERDGEKISNDNQPTLGLY